MQQQQHCYYGSRCDDEYNTCGNSDLVVPILPWMNGVGGGFLDRSDADDLSRVLMMSSREAKAAAASRSHSEAERRRRERINNHLATLRTLLPTTTPKTDKASLLAEVIQHVKELKRQTSEISETTTSNLFPTEIDELIVKNYASGEDGKAIIKASICCEDRSDLLPDLMKSLKALKLRAVKAEIATLGRRVKNVLFITTEKEPNDDDYEEQCQIIRSLQEAFKGVMEKSIGDNAGGVKRQRTINNVFNYRPF